jgi:Kelch motif
MTGNNDVTLEVENPLLAKQKQSLNLSMKSANCRTIIISGELGADATALMTDSEFNNIKKKIKLTKPMSGAATKKDPSVTQKGGLNKWLIELTFTKVPCQTALDFPEFLVSSAGETKIEARDQQSDALLASVDVVKADRQPQIELFECNNNNLQNGPVDLSWKIGPESQYVTLELVEQPTGGAATKVPLKDNSVRTVTRAVKEQTTDYTLKLSLATGQSLAERRLRIHAFGNAKFKSYGRPLSIKGGVFGLSAHEGSIKLPEAFLIALLQDDPAKPSVSLWKIKKGFDPEPGDWERIAEDIPLDAARRPGIVFKNKLWLIGGDCCHPDRQDFNVGSYNLTTKNATFGDLERIGKWPPDRMGHALVAPDQDHLWVMGGWAQDGGPRKDIWEFDGAEWIELPQAPWKERSLFGAMVTSDAVWIAGGFTGDPGGKSCDDIWRYDKQTKHWDAVTPTINPSDPPSKAQYCTCTFFNLYNKPCLIATYNWPDEYRYEHYFYSVKRETKGWSTTKYLLTAEAIGLVRSLSYYRIDSTVFDKTAFFRFIGDDDKIVSEQISYFVAPYGTGA